MFHFTALTLFLGFILLALAIVGGVVLLVARLLRPGASRAGDPADEARTMQELYQGLNRMERRVEALETLLLEQERQRKEDRSEP